MGIIKEHNIDGYRIMTETYYSTSDIVNDLKKRSITDRNFDNMQDGTLGGNSKSFCGVETYDEAIELLEKGYQPIVKKMKTNISENVRGLSKRISFSNDVVGFAPVVPLAIMGVPTSMINTRIKPIKAKVIDLYVDITYIAFDTSDEIIKSSSRILSVVLKLEQAGYIYTVAGKGAYCAGPGAATQGRIDELYLRLDETARELRLLGTEESEAAARLHAIWQEEDKI